MGLDEEVNMDGGVDIAEEVLVDGHEQLDIPMVVHSAPNRAQFMIHRVQISLVDQELLDQEIRKRLLLLEVHI